MDVEIRLTVNKRTPVDISGWEFPDDPAYYGASIPTDMTVPVVLFFQLTVPEGMNYPIALTWARTQMNSLSAKYQAINARIDEDSLRAEYNEYRKIK